MDDRSKVVGEALGWARDGRRVALATVVSSWGSSPRPAGARMAVDETGHFVGSVSGGCVEGEVLATAAEVMAGGRPALLEFGVSDERAWSVGLACGGAISIFVEGLSNSVFFQPILEGLSHGRSSASLLALDSGERAPLDSDGFAHFDLDEEGARAIRRALASGREGLVETSRGKFFLEFWRPPLRLFIVGAVHIAQALAPIARIAGYAVAIVDPRGAFATAERFAGFDLLAEWPEDVMPRVRLDESCALVALTHEPRIDDPALIAALRSPAFYVGALGSATTAEKRRKRLSAQGFGERSLSRIHGPIGLAIGAANPEEIAVAIAAEMTAALRGRHAVGSERMESARMGSAAE